jgi:hypothetical protein
MPLDVIEQLSERGPSLLVKTLLDGIIAPLSEGSGVPFARPPGILSNFLAPSGVQPFRPRFAIRRSPAGPLVRKRSSVKKLDARLVGGFSEKIPANRTVIREGVTWIHFFV